MRRRSLALFGALVWTAAAAGPSVAHGQDGGGAAPPGAVSEPAPAPLPPSTEPAPGTPAAASPTMGETMAEREARERADRRRRETEDEDDGRTADLLWIELGVGYGYSDIVSFNNDNFLPGLEEQTGSGLAAHAVAGIRVFFLSLGARGTLGTTPGYDLWSILFDATLRLPVPVVEPYVRFGIGYAFLGRANYQSPGDSEAKVYGLAVEGGAGVDIYLAPVLSIGAGVDFAFLNMTRQKIESCGMPGSADCNVGAIDFQETGDSAGFQLRASAHAALHF